MQFGSRSVVWWADRNGTQIGDECNFARRLIAGGQKGEWAGLQGVHGTENAYTVKR
jgi:hypothetical protein